MKAKFNKLGVIATTGLLALTACGGSSDDGAGQLSNFQVSPAEVKIKSGVTTCPLFKTGEYAIIGGTAPYTVLSPDYQGVTFSAAGGTVPTNAGKYTVSNRNDQFAIFVEGCFDPAVVTVLDSLKRVAVIKVSYAAASGAS